MGSRKHVLGVDVDPRRGRGNFRGHVPPYYKLLQGECAVSCRKTADPNDMWFGTKIWVAPKNTCEIGARIRHGKGQFGRAAKTGRKKRITVSPGALVKILVKMGKNVIKLIFSE